MTPDSDKAALHTRPQVTPLSEMRPRYKKVLIWASLAFGLYLAMLVIGDGQDARHALAGLQASTLLAMLGLALANYALRFIRWRLYLQRLGYQLPWFWDGCCYIAGFAFTATPGKVGELMRGLFLKKFRVRYVHTISACLAERLLDLAAVAAIAALALYKLEQYRWLWLGVIGAVLGMVWLMGRPRALAWILGRITTLLRGRSRSMLARLEDAIGAVSLLMAGWPLALGLLLGLCGWLVEATAFALAAEALGAPLPLWQAAAIYATGLLAGALSFLPGGLVGTELVMTALLITAGVATETAIAITLVTRLATLWFSVGLGVLAATWVELRSPDGREAVAG
jgi:glycosyltransferase 2 family protein